MSWLCLFRQCRWVWIFNVRNLAEWTGIDVAIPGTLFGVYQCTTCKTISIGKPSL